MAAAKQDMLLPVPGRRVCLFVAFLFFLCFRKAGSVHDITSLFPTLLSMHLPGRAGSSSENRLSRLPCRPCAVRSSPCRVVLYCSRPICGTGRFRFTPPLREQQKPTTRFRTDFASMQGGPRVAAPADCVVTFCRITIP